MSKKLKIRFVKFEKVLVMHILEQEGYFRDSEYVGMGYPELCCDRIYLCDEEERGNLGVAARQFDTNASRDEYLKTVIRWISEEQFAEGSGELKVDEMCEVRDVPRGEWKQRKLVAILPKRFANRFIVEDDCDKCDWTYFAYARPIGCRIEPKIDGDIYTWEEK